MKKLFLVLFVFVFPSLVFSNGVWVYDSKADWTKCSTMNCNIFRYPGTVTIGNIFSDEFENPVLGNQWVWENYGLHGSSYSLTITPGTLRITSEANAGWWCSLKNSPMVYQAFDKTTNFEVDVRISNTNLYYHQWGSMFLFVNTEDNNGNYLQQYRIGYDSASGFATIDVTDDCSVKKTFITSINGTKYDFKVVNEYNSPYNKLSFYYKTSTATEWIPLHVFQNISFERAFIGVERADTSAGQWSEFDYFHYSGPTFTAATILSDVIDMGAAPDGTGTIKWEQELGIYGSIKIRTATSPDAVNWSGWSGWYTDNFGTSITNPNARYIRFQVDLSTTDYRYSPELYSLRIEYPVVAPMKATIQSTTHADNAWSNAKDVSFTWYGADYNSVTVAAYYYALNSTPTTASQSTANTYLSVTGLSEGITDFYLMPQADWRNNSTCAAPSMFRLKIDTTSPAQPVVVSCSHRQFETEGFNDFSIALTSTDALSGVAGYSYIVAREATAPDDTIDSVGNEINIDDMQNGRWYFSAAAIDSAGNSSAAVYYMFDIDYKGNVIDGGLTKVYPTICVKSMNLKYVLAAETMKVKIYLKDSAGRTVITFDGETQAGEHTLTHDVTGLANGVYFAVIIAQKLDGKEETNIEKFIVKK